MDRFSRVEVKQIKSNALRSSFDEKQIEELASAIIKTGELLRPLILKQDGVESYTLLEGDLEFFAAVRAREKDPRTAETVNAFVISPKNETEAREQIEAINAADKVVNPLPDKDNHGIERQLSNLNARFETIGNEITEIKTISSSIITKLEKNKPIKVETLLELLNNKDERKIETELLRYKVPEKKIMALLAAKRKTQNGQFNSYQEVVKETDKLAEKGLLAIIDTFEHFSRR